MSDLLGADFAPSIVVGYVTELGGFYATLDAVPMITLHNGERVKVANVEAVRQLSCDDPDDMRAIWRLAALAMGATYQEALSAILIDRPYQINPKEEYSEYRLSVGGVVGLGAVWASERGVMWIWRPGCLSDLSRATATLCNAMWGPK